MAKIGSRAAAPADGTTPADAPPRAAGGEAPPRSAGGEALPGWYRTAAAASWRFVAIVAALGLLVYALVYLRVVVLPVIVALLASTLLLPLVRWMKLRGVPDGLAAAGAMIAAIVVIGGIVTAVAPSVANQFDDLRPQAEDGIRQA